METAMTTLAATLIVLATVIAMEGLAWSSHKYVMHGFGWGWHRDHHEPHDGFFERNDLYALVGAAISITFSPWAARWCAGQRRGRRPPGSASACWSMA
jgi:hypothetical protein